MAASAAGTTAASAHPLLSSSSVAPLPDWVDFSLGEDVRGDRRLEQDRQWAKAISDGRVHLSHREFALLYGPRFQAAIEDFHMVHLLVRGMYSQGSSLHRLNELVLTFIVEYAFPGQAPLVSAIVAQCETEYRLASPYCQAMQAAQDDFLVCVRKRPLLWQEVDVGAYDVTSIPSHAHAMDSYHHFVVTNQQQALAAVASSALNRPNNATTADAADTPDFPQTLRLHEGKLARNGRLLSMTHHHMLFDRVYDATVDTNAICDDVVAPLIRRTLAGKASTLLCFGQTGTGKTYTLDGVLHYVAEGLVGQQVRVWFYEVHGKKCYDLLQQRREIQLRFDGADRLHVCGAHVHMTNGHVRNAEELRTITRQAMALRLSEVTERNPISSRSHAVCVIEVVVPASAPKSTAATAVGRMTLVDLAGSERNYETQRMSGAMHKESAEINLALMSLKNCFRAYHRHEARIPYRESTLTKVLKPCFFRPSSLSTTTAGNENQHVPVTLAESPVAAEAVAVAVDQSTTIKPPPPPSPTLSTATTSTTTVDKHDDRHFTVIIATISPSPIDLQHSLNTLKHVLLMTRTPVYRVDGPNAAATTTSSSVVLPLPQSSAVTVEIPKTSLAALSTVPMSHWTEEQVISWLATVERGKFAHLVLPRGTTGDDLTKLSVTTIAQLFASSEQFGRRGDAGEGPVWVITADIDPHEVATGTATAAAEPAPAQAQVGDNGAAPVAPVFPPGGPQPTTNQPPVLPAGTQKWQALSLALYNAVRREEHAYHRHQSLLQHWKLQQLQQQQPQVPPHM